MSPTRLPIKVSLNLKQIMLHLCSLCQTHIKMNYFYLPLYLTQILNLSLSNEMFSNPIFGVPSMKGDLLISSPQTSFRTPEEEESY